MSLPTCGVFALVLWLCAISASYGAELPDPQRQQELLYLLRQDCGSCHGMTLRGGLGPSLLPEALAGKSPEYLRAVIAEGIPERAMPPWSAILAASEINFLVDYLQNPGADSEAGQ